MIKQRREGRGVYIRSYGQLTVMMSFSYERENFFSAINETCAVVAGKISTMEYSIHRVFISCGFKTLFFSSGFLKSIY